MTYVVTEACIKCKYTDCVEVCPVDCFYEGAQMLYIHPEECIDCEACVPECPVEAIFADVDVPPRWSGFVVLNAERSAALKPTGHILQRQKPAPGCADENFGGRSSG